MTVPAAEQTSAYSGLFEEFARSRTSREPGWLLSARRSALERFVAEGFPSTRQEAWRFTSVAPIARTSFRLPDGGERRRLSWAVDLASDWDLSDAIRVAFVDGRFAPELSSSHELDGLRVRSLDEVIAREPDVLQAFLGHATDDHASVFTALNAAFFTDGALVEILPGAVVSAPIHIVFLSTGSESNGRPPLFSPRVLMLAGRGSESVIVESYGALGEGRYLSAAVTEIVVQEGARIDHYKLQQESLAAFHVATLTVRQERDSRFSDHAVSAGAALARNDIGVELAGEGAECVLDGLFLAGGEQHTDTHTYIDHARPHCGSRELYKGVLNDRSRGVFHGTILVRPGAQKTDALQVNRNLLLSKEALVNSTPAFEIHADDVKCKHGSTTGHLDAQALFYLCSRGLGQEAARSLLIHAFANEVVGRARLEPFRARVADILRQKLPAAPQGAIP